MKIKRLSLYITLSIALLFSSFIAFYPTGAPPAKTGSPGDGANCTECHGGSPQTVVGWITSNIPAGGYVPGTTYQITATNSLTGTGKYGFEVSPQNAAGTLLGTLTAGATSQLVGTNKYVTHISASTTVNTWTFSWTAPAAGTGAVTFYGAFARNKPGPVRLSTLAVNEQTVSLPGNAGPISGPSAVCKNNTYNYSTGTISGATGYVWTVPAGVSITSGQGTTSITVNVSQSAVSGNISVYGTNTAGNGTPSNLPVTVSTVPVQPSAVIGSSVPCAGVTEIYSITNVAGVSYFWTVPAGSVITAGQGTNSITVTIGQNSGNVQVTPSNTCGAGIASGKNITVNSIPETAATPSGPDLVDLNITTISDYTTVTIPSATQYTWEITPAEAGTISGTAASSTVTWGNFLGTASIRVKASNTCGDGTWSTVKQTLVINTTGSASYAASEISIFPTPSNGKFTIKSPISQGTDSYRILKTSGEILQSGKLAVDGSTSVTASLSSGLYILILEINGVPVKQKLLIQN